jgi:hypothetical protein
MHTNERDIIVKRKPVIVDSITIDIKTVVATGRLVTTARLQQDWFSDLERPRSVAQALKNTGSGLDLFTFLQRLPETTLRYDYYMEWEQVTALPLKNYSTGWKSK